MNLALSQIGNQMSNLTGVRAIMKDIQETLAAKKGQEFINLSAGNPVILPEIEQMWRDYTHELLDSQDYGEVVCRYGSSQGYQPLVDAIVTDFNRRYNLKLTARNVLITPGSQSLYFYAMNAFGGQTAGSQMKQVVLPLSPDYTGYGGMALAPESVLAYKPTLDIDAANHS
jgi:valine--pyruvate aminotransferase